MEMSCIGPESRGSLTKTDLASPSIINARRCPQEADALVDVGNSRTVAPEYDQRQSPFAYRRDGAVPLTHYYETRLNTLVRSHHSGVPRTLAKSLNGSIQYARNHASDFECPFAARANPYA